MAENQDGAKPVESFEHSLEDLEKVVRELEGGDLTLERSLELFERGAGGVLARLVLPLEPASA